ncbi:MAG: hypothetical protein NTY06_00845 [Candidatus Gottesmanbacteria bacterium]|nr:hypothetical protein [Candidatus Gottesmanbacteria bacterium]
MHRNTYLLVSILAVCAALLVGVNIGKRLTKQKPSPTPNPVTVNPTPTPGEVVQTYTDTYCGFSLNYPTGFTVLENASGSAILNNTSDKTQSITLTCQKAIPKPALTADKIETLTIPKTGGASVSAKLYHDSSAKDGTPMDIVIFRHPTNGMDSFIAGYGNAFNAAIKTLQILP